MPFSSSFSYIKFSTGNLPVLPVFSTSVLQTSFTAKRNGLNNLSKGLFNPFPHTTILQQTTLTYDKKWKTLWQKEKLHILCNFFVCDYVFKKRKLLKMNNFTFATMFQLYSGKCFWTKWVFKYALHSTTFSNLSSFHSTFSILTYSWLLPICCTL